MATPTSDDERQRILDLVAQGWTYTRISRETGRSPQTVSRIAKAAGHEVEHSNLARVETAQETRRAVGEERRARLASDVADKLDEALASMGGARVEVVMVGRGESRRAELIQVPPSGADWRDWASAVRQMQQTMLDLVRYDERGEESMAAVDRWLEDMNA